MTEQGSEGMREEREMSGAGESAYVYVYICVCEYVLVHAYVSRSFVFNDISPFPLGIFDELASLEYL